jgi:hypothetical protein
MPIPPAAGIAPGQAIVQEFRAGLRAALAKAGFSQADIDMMTKQNPAWLLGLK